MNVFIISGIISKEPQIFNAMSSERAVTRFDIANHGRKDKDKTVFFHISAFGKDAEFVYRYFKKGAHVLAECEIRNGDYEKDGKKVYAYNFILKKIEFAGAKAKEQEEAAREADEKKHDGEIPF